MADPRRLGYILEISKVWRKEMRRFIVTVFVVLSLAMPVMAVTGYTGPQDAVADEVSYSSPSSVKWCGDSKC